VVNARSRETRSIFLRVRRVALVINSLLCGDYMWSLKIASDAKKKEKIHNKKVHLDFVREFAYVHSNFDFRPNGQNSFKNGRIHAV
jgi:hypothetical protein